MIESNIIVEHGACYVLYVLDVGYAIDIEHCEKLCSLPTERLRFKANHRTPEEFEYDPPPLRIIQASFPFAIGEFKSAPDVELTLYDFGALSVTFSFPLRKVNFSELVTFATLIDNDESLRTNARQIAHALVETISSGIERPKIRESLEDYVIWEISRTAANDSVRDIITKERIALAQMLRSEPGDLSEKEVSEALSYQTAYSSKDFVVVDWNAALLLGPEEPAVRAVLEFANVELLEIRLLDEQLDQDMEEARTILTISSPSQSALQRIGHLQLDSVLLFEAINNSLKLVGDHYLARLYQLASKSFHLEERDATILRKLAVIKDIYTQMEAAASARRMEILEIIIIVLFMISVFLQLFGK